MPDLIVSAFSNALMPPAGEPPPEPPPTGSKNWGPGNYIEGSADNEWASIMNRLSLANDPDGHWKGAMMRVSWTELEGAEGVYTGMDKIAGWLSDLAPFAAKRLMIFIQFKTFGTNSHAVPAYMRTAPYADPDGFGNGEFKYTSSNGGDGGYVPNMHVAAVRTRFNALITELATRFNNHPNLEAIVFSEASIAKPVGAPSNWSFTPWYDGMLLGLQHCKTALSKVQICQWVNSPRIDMEYWVPQLRTAQVGIGMTDLCPEDKGFNYRSDVPNDEQPRGNIEWCQLHEGVAMIMGHASQPAMAGQISARGQLVAGTIQGQPHVYGVYPMPATTRQTVFDFAVDEVKCTHVVWISNTSAMPATGDRDPRAKNPGDVDAQGNPLPPPYADAYTTISDAYSGTYAGKSFNLVTDNWIHNSPNIVTKTARPTGWT